MACAPGGRPWTLRSISTPSPAALMVAEPTLAPAAFLRFTLTVLAGLDKDKASTATGSAKETITLGVMITKLFQSRWKINFARPVRGAVCQGSEPNVRLHVLLTRCRWLRHLRAEVRNPPGCCGSLSFSTLRRRYRPPSRPYPRFWPGDSSSTIARNRSRNPPLVVQVRRAPTIRHQPLSKRACRPTMRE